MTDSDAYAPNVNDARPEPDAAEAARLNSATAHLGEAFRRLGWSTQEAVEQMGRVGRALAAGRRVT